MSEGKLEFKGEENWRDASLRASWNLSFFETLTSMVANIFALTFNSDGKLL